MCFSVVKCVRLVEPMFLCEGTHPLFLQLVLCFDADSSAVHASQDVLGKVSFGVPIHCCYAVLCRVIAAEAYSLCQ